MRLKHEGATRWSSCMPTIFPFISCFDETSFSAAVIGDSKNIKRILDQRKDLKQRLSPSGVSNVMKAKPRDFPVIRSAFELSRLQK
jgi:hypothetical protein